MRSVTKPPLATSAEPTRRSTLRMVTASGVAGEGGRWGPDAEDAAISCHITVPKSLASGGSSVERTIDPLDRRKSVILAPGASASARRSARIRAVCPGLSLVPPGTVHSWTVPGSGGGPLHQEIAMSALSLTHAQQQFTARLSAVEDAVQYAFRGRLRPRTTRRRWPRPAPPPGAPGTA